MLISDLQLSLIAAGAIAVTAVWGYNLWQERKYRKVAEQIFRQDQVDVIVPDATPDEAYGTDLTANADPDDERIEPVFTIAPAEPESVVLTTAEPDEHLVDTMLELVLTPRMGQSVSGQKLIEAGSDLAGKLTKAQRWIVRNGGIWKEFDNNPSGAYHDIRATLQLADRHGALAAPELDAFVDAVRAIAEEGGGTLAPPSRTELLAHAAVLDGLCAGVDVQIAVHVVHRSGNLFPCSKLRGLAEASGLSLAADGSFYLIDDGDRPLFSLSNHGAAPFVAEEMQTASTPGVTFWLDVPRVPDGPAIFDHLVAVAQQLAKGLDGILVDDQRNPLSEKMLETIRAKIVELQAEMAAGGLPAGGRRALRLFA